MFIILMLWINSALISCLPFFVSTSSQFSFTSIIFPLTFVPNDPEFIWQFMPIYILMSSFVITTTPFLFLICNRTAICIACCCGTIMKKIMNNGIQIATNDPVYNRLHPLFAIFYLKGDGLISITTYLFTYGKYSYLFILYSLSNV